MRASRLPAQFLRFCAVGVAGFAVDAAGLLALVDAHLAGPVWGRLISFGAAVCTTFALNRRWTFNDERGPFWDQVVRYLSVQGVGFLINLGIYVLLFVNLPQPFNAPLFCIGVASACALMANFAGARWVVFRGGAVTPAD